MSENPFPGDFKFEGMDLMSFLNQAFLASRPANPVIPESPTANVEELLRDIEVGRQIFVAINESHPFAVLLNPVDKLDIQMWANERTPRDLWRNPEEAPHVAFGMLMQPAKWIESGMYEVISKEDYDALNRPENLI